MNDFISSRLHQAICFIPHCRCMADVGSDHGYASLYVLNEKIAEKAIATDISPDSLAKTERLLRQSDTKGLWECRCGNGLQVLQPGEAQAALIAGMGSELIADIVLQSPSVSGAMELLSLQPMNSAEPLRRRLQAGGFHILREAITYEGGKYYQSLAVAKGSAPTLTPLEEELGSFIYRERIPLCAEYIAARITALRHIAEAIGKPQTPAAEQRLRETKQKIEQYQEVWAWAVAR